MKITSETFFGAMQEFGSTDPAALIDWYNNTGHTSEEIKELRKDVATSVSQLIEICPSDDLLIPLLAAAMIATFRCGMLCGMSQVEPPDSVDWRL